MLYILGPIIAFLIVVLLMKPAMRFLNSAGIRGIDQQKQKKPRIPTSAGIIAVVGILAGIFFYIGIDTFIIHSGINLSLILAGSFSILIITLVGFFDDIAMSPKPERIKEVREYRVGLKQWQKALLTLPAAVPLMAVQAGVTSMSLPFIGPINFGIVYPLLLIPLAVLTVSNATNMLAGMNGLEAGLGAIVAFFLGLFALLSDKVNSPEAVVISFSATAALLAILIWNKYPARILPGDSLTYMIGAVIVTTVVLGNMEKFGILIFIPWVIEAFLKLRSKFQARSFGDLQHDGTLKSPYKKTYSLTHLLMKAKPLRESQIVLILFVVEILLAVVVTGLLLSNLL